MRTMRYAASLAAIGALAVAGAIAAGRSQPAFEKLKSLEGVWDARMHDGTPMTSTFKVIAKGSAVMEEMSVEGMVNVYHPDGDKLMVTHYCAGNNQPRMEADGLAADGRTLKFTFKDVTNRAGANDSIMNGLVLTFKDADHITQEWSSSGDPKEPHLVVEYQRRK